MCAVAAFIYLLNNVKIQLPIYVNKLHFLFSISHYIKTCISSLHLTVEMFMFMYKKILLQIFKF